jgi:hypothetical protein
MELIHEKKESNKSGATVPLNLPKLTRTPAPNTPIPLSLTQMLCAGTEPGHPPPLGAAPPPDNCSA